MNKFTVFTVFCLAVCLSGCAVNARLKNVAPDPDIGRCDTGDLQIDAICLRLETAKAKAQLSDELRRARAEHQEALEKAKAARIVAKHEARRVETAEAEDAEADETAEADDEANEDERPRPAARRSQPPPERLAADPCTPGRMLRVDNPTNYYYEVRADDLHVCSTGVVPGFVKSANGRDRPALVIPPGGSGLYGFYPYRDLGDGRVISTNDPSKEYDVDVYDASGGDALNPYTPAAYVTTVRQQVPIPFGYSPKMKGIWRNFISAYQVRGARY